MKKLAILSWALLIILVITVPSHTQILQAIVGASNGLPTPVGSWNLCGFPPPPTSSTTTEADLSGHGGTASWVGTKAGGVSGTYYTQSSHTARCTYSGYFNGTDNALTVPNSTALTITGPMTICAFFYAPSQGTYKVLVDKEGTSPNSGYYLGLNYGNNYSVGFGFNGGGNQIDTQSNKWSANTWTQTCGVFTGTGLIIYINGSSSITGGSSTAPITNSNQLTIGVYNMLTGITWVKGQMQDTEIYNVALTASQVASLYNAQLAALRLDWLKDQMRGKEYAYLGRDWLEDSLRAA